MVEYILLYFQLISSVEKGADVFKFTEGLEVLNVTIGIIEIWVEA